MSKIENLQNSSDQSFFKELTKDISDNFKIVIERRRFKKKWNKFFKNDFDSTKISVADCLYLLVNGTFDEWCDGPKTIQNQKIWSKLFYTVFQNLDPNQQRETKILMQESLPEVMKERLVGFLFVEYKENLKEFNQFTLDLCSSFLVSTKGDAASVRKFANFIIDFSSVPKEIKFRLGFGSGVSANILK